MAFAPHFPLFPLTFGPRLQVKEKELEGVGLCYIAKVKDLDQTYPMKLSAKIEMFSVCAASVQWPLTTCVN